MPHFKGVGEEIHSVSTEEWMAPCLEANYTRGFRISVNESHWTLEPGHVLMKADDNETLTPLPGIRDTRTDTVVHKKNLFFLRIVSL